MTREEWPGASATVARFGDQPSPGNLQQYTTLLQRTTPRKRLAYSWVRKAERSNGSNLWVNLFLGAIQRLLHRAAGSSRRAEYDRLGYGMLEVFCVIIICYLELSQHSRNEAMVSGE